MTLCLDLLLACVGYGQITGVPRFTLGQVGMLQVLQGMSFIPTMIGLFAISGAIGFYANKIQQISDEIPDKKRMTNGEYNRKYEL